MIGEGYLLIQDYQVLMLGEGEMSIVDIEPIEMIGIGEMSATSSADYIFASRPPMQCILRESAVETCDIYATRPATTAALEVGIYEPPALQYIYAVRPPMTASLFVETSSPVSINAVRPTALARMADHDYTEIYATLPERIAFAQEDPTPRDAQIVSVVYTFGELVGRTEHVIFINSYGQLVDTISGTKEYVAEIISSVNASSSFSALGSFILPLDSTANLQGSMAASANGLPDVDSGGRVWVVNMDTGASSQYDGYGFYDFMEIDGIGYGFADDGIYRIDGDNDNGSDIQSLIEFGRSLLIDDKGNTIYNKKKVINVYVGVSSGNKMYLKVDTDGQIYVYEARSNSTAIKNHRFDVGKGLSGNYFNFTLLNQEGSDFELETISFEPVVLKGKI